MLKVHLRAMASLKSNERELDENSFVIRQLLNGRINDSDIRTLTEIDSWCESKDDGKTLVDIRDFNKQQQRALALESLTQIGIVLIQGPPGTGKSHTICHGLLPQVVARNEKVLVVCNSNVAVDALMLKCVKSVDCLQDRMIRCGFKDKVSEDIVNLGLFAEGDVSRLVEDYNGYARPQGSNSNTDDKHVQNQIRSRQVVFTTIHFASKEKSKSNNEDKAYWNFDTLILDEAAQIEDSRLFIVISRCLSLKKIILVGDPKQLQPYVPDSIRRQKYGSSTMERLMEASASDGEKTPFVMLEQQFRMAPLLRELVSRLYYDNRLTDGKCVLNRGPNQDKVKLKPLLVVNVTGSVKEFNRLHQSYENKAEADVVNVIYEFLFTAEFQGVLEGDLTAADVCILTPYNRHKDRLRMAIFGLDEDQLNTDSGQVLPYIPTGSPTKSQAVFGTQEQVGEEVSTALANIDTVDKFQGSERKVVIISTCIDTNPLRASDKHFINVACSRAQHLLIVVGNFTNGLSQNADWSYVCSQAQERGTYLEHEVTMAPVVEDQERTFDIHRDSLEEKLKSLLDPPSKRPKCEDSSSIS